MQVKLSYTIEEEDILKEAANLLGLRARTLQQTIEDFQNVQLELTQEEDPPNLSRVEEHLASVRRGLRDLDLRTAEVAGIIREYSAHRLAAASLAASPPAPEVTEPEDAE